MMLFADMVLYDIEDRPCQFPYSLFCQLLFTFTKITGQTKSTSSRLLQIS